MFLEIQQTLIWLLRALTDYKLLFERSISFSDDAVHIYMGVAIQLLVAVIFRSSVARRGPLLTVLVLELANEILDIRHDVWPSASMQLGESIKDVLLTLAVPILLFAVSRRAPSILAPSRSPSAGASELTPGAAVVSDEAPELLRREENS